MKNELKIEIETEDGQIHWRHYRFPRWKLTNDWALRFLDMLTKTLQGKMETRPQPKTKPRPMPTSKKTQSSAMRREAEFVLEELGLNKNKRNRLLDRAGPAGSVEELVMKCLGSTT